MFFILFSFFDTVVLADLEQHNVAQVGLEFVAILLLQPPDSALLMTVILNAVYACSVARIVMWLIVSVVLVLIRKLLTV